MRVHYLFLSLCLTLGTIHGSSPTTLRTQEEAETGSCIENNKRYTPLDNIPGQRKTRERSVEACQARCARVAGCKHFSFFTYKRQRSCHLSGSGAELKDQKGFRAGPRICTHTKGSGSHTCITVGGRQPGKACVFPFDFKGKNYSSCTTDGNKPGVDTPWCSTLVNAQGYHVGRHWGNCPSDGCTQDLVEEPSTSSFSTTSSTSASESPAHTDSTNSGSNGTTPQNISGSNGTTPQNISDSNGATPAYTESTNSGSNGTTPPTTGAPIFPAWPYQIINYVQIFLGDNFHF